MVLHTSCFYRSRNLQLRPRLHVSVFVWKRSFFPLWFRLSFTCNQWRRPPKTRLFKTALQSGDFWKSRFVALVWMEWKQRGFWEGFRHDVGYHGHLMCILPTKSHCISLSFGHLETIEKRQRMDGDFLNTEKKNLHFRTKTNPCGQGLREIRHHSVCCCGVAAL